MNAVRKGKPLTPRERELMMFFSHGLTGKEAAHAMGISDKTVQAHAANIRAKMNARTNVQAAVRWWSSTRD